MLGIHLPFLMCAKNHFLIFSSFLDTWENVEWPRFLDHPVVPACKRYITDTEIQMSIQGQRSFIHSFL